MKFSNVEIGYQLLFVRKKKGYDITYIT